MAHNPYAAPLAKLEGASTSSELEADRRAHIGIEQSLGRIANFYLFTGIFLFLSLVCSVAVLAIHGRPEGMRMIHLAIIFGVYVVFGPVSIWIGLGLRRRNRAVRIPASIFLGLALLGFPAGTVIGGYHLWALWSSRGKRIFEPDYQAVIDATPQVVSKLSPADWAALGLFVLVFGGLVILSIVW